MSRPSAMPRSAVWRVFFSQTATTEIYTYCNHLSLHDARPMSELTRRGLGRRLMAAIAEQLMADGYKAVRVWALRDNPCRGFYTALGGAQARSEEHTSELPSLMRNSYAVFCLKKTTEQDQNSARLPNSLSCAYTLRRCDM